MVIFRTEKITAPKPRLVYEAQPGKILMRGNEEDWDWHKPELPRRRTVMWIGVALGGWIVLMLILAGVLWAILT
jgi:hypothetical protein